MEPLLTESLKMAVSAELQPVASQVLHIKSILIELRDKHHVKDPSELRKWQLKLDDLENRFKPGPDYVWGGRLNPSHIPAGQGVLNELMDDCHDIIDNIIDGLPESVVSEQNISKRKRSKKPDVLSSKEVPTSTAVKPNLPSEQAKSSAGNKLLHPKMDESSKAELETKPRELTGLQFPLNVAKELTASSGKHEPADMKKKQFERPDITII